MKSLKYRRSHYLQKNPEFRTEEGKN